MDAKFWEDRAVLVTGADGFIGSHLCDALVGFGARVTAFVRATSSGELHNILPLKSDLEVFRGDLADSHSVREAVSSLKGETGSVLFHLGAQAHVGESWDRPIETFRVNVFGTLNLLAAVRDAGVKLHRFDMAGTSEEYGNSGGQVLDESTPVNPSSPYATSKVAADFISLNFRAAYGLPVVVVRLFNNYGPRQNPRYITGAIITQALKRSKVVLGNLSSSRDFTFIDDGVQGHLLAAQKGKPGDVYCIGSGKSFTMKDWASRIIQLGKEQGYWDTRSIASDTSRLRPGKSDVQRLRVDASKAHKELGWKPIVSQDEGILKTIDWYAKNEARWSGRVDW